MESHSHKNTLVVFLLAITTFFLTPMNIFADSTTHSDDFSIKAKAALAVDVETGKILYEQNSNEILPIASISKLLSFYIIQQKIAEGELNWSDQIVISKEIAELSQDLTLSNVILDEGDIYTVEELFEAAVIVSANAATIALAEQVAGTEKEFVDLMKEQLITFGMKDPFIVNSTGLNNEDINTTPYPGSELTDENKLTAKEVAIIARHLIQDFPETLAITAQSSATFHSKSGGPAIMYSTNWLLPDMPYAKAEVDGLKTGTTILAGPSLVTSAVKEDRRIITVVLNAQNDDESPDARFTETSRLIDYAYEEWSYKNILVENETLPEVSPLPVLYGKTSEVPVIVKENLNLLVPKDWTKTDFNYHSVLKDKQQTVIAPIQKGEALGTFTIEEKNETHYLEPDDFKAAQKKKENLPFYAENEVVEVNFFVKIWRQLFN